MAWKAHYRTPKGRTVETRSFNGEHFRLVKNGGTKAQMEKVANNARKKGYKARVTNDGYHGNAVWVRRS